MAAVNPTATNELRFTATATDGLPHRNPTSIRRPNRLADWVSLMLAAKNLYI
jgi:hypothetical protein